VDAPSVVVYSPADEDDDDVVSGVGNLEELAPEVAVVVFGPSAEPGSLARAVLRAGARGFVRADMPPEEIVRIREGGAQLPSVFPWRVSCNEL